MFPISAISMKHKLIPKYFLPCAIALSLLAFLYVNFDAHSETICKVAGKALTEQSAVSKQEEQESQTGGGIQAPGLSVVARAFALAKRFIPVSN